MIKTVLILFSLCFFSSTVYSQYELDKADFTPKINSDSLSDIILHEFILQFNKDSIDYSKLLKNNYNYLQLVQENVGQKYLNTGFNNKSEGFSLNDEDAIKLSINRSKEFQKLYKKQKKIIVKQKKKFGLLASDDFKLTKTVYLSGTFESFDKSIFITFENKNQLQKMKEINFAVFFYKGTKIKFMTVANVK